MKIASQLRELIECSDSSVKDISIASDTSQSNLLNKFSRDNFRLSEVSEIANLIGVKEIKISFIKDEEIFEISNLNQELVTYDNIKIRKMFNEVIKQSKSTDDEMLKLLQNLLSELLKIQFKFGQHSQAFQIDCDIYDLDDASGLKSFSGLDDLDVFCEECKDNIKDIIDNMLSLYYNYLIRNI